MNLVNSYIITYDADALAFITVAGLTDSVQKIAINTLVLEFKSSGLWAKMKAIYPIVGGVDSSHKFNLKDPRDLDIAFRLQFTGSITHSLNGMTSGSGYANTFLKESVDLTLNSKHISVYVRTNLTNDGCEIGVANGSNSSTQILSSFSGNLFCRVSDNASGVIVSTSDTRGFYVATRNDSSTRNVFKNGTKYAVSATSTVNNTVPYYLMSRNNAGVSDLFSIRQVSFYSIGEGLSDADASMLLTIVQHYQTALGRQV